MNQNFTGIEIKIPGVSRVFGYIDEAGLIHATNFSKASNHEKGSRSAMWQTVGNARSRGFSARNNTMESFFNDYNGQRELLEELLRKSPLPENPGFLKRPSFKGHFQTKGALQFSAAEKNANGAIQNPELRIAKLKKILYPNGIGGSRYFSPEQIRAINQAHYSGKWSELTIAERRFKLHLLITQGGLTPTEAGLCIRSGLCGAPPTLAAIKKDLAALKALNKPARDLSPEQAMVYRSVAGNWASDGIPKQDGVYIFIADREGRMVVAPRYDPDPSNPSKYFVKHDSLLNFYSNQGHDPKDLVTAGQYRIQNGKVVYLNNKTSFKPGEEVMRPTLALAEHYGIEIQERTIKANFVPQSKAENASQIYYEHDEELAIVKAIQKVNENPVFLQRRKQIEAVMLFLSNSFPNETNFAGIDFTRIQNILPKTEGIFDHWQSLASGLKRDDLSWFLGNDSRGFFFAKEGNSYFAPTDFLVETNSLKRALLKLSESGEIDRKEVIALFEGDLFRPTLLTENLNLDERKVTNLARSKFGQQFMKFLEKIHSQNLLSTAGTPGAAFEHTESSITKQLTRLRRFGLGENFARDFHTCLAP